MKITWYLHSHFEWLRLACSSIVGFPLVRLAAHEWKSLDGLLEMSNFYCHPGRAGGSPAFASSAAACSQMVWKSDDNNPHKSRGIIRQLASVLSPHPRIRRRRFAAIR